MRIHKPIPKKQEKHVLLEQFVDLLNHIKNKLSNLGYRKTTSTFLLATFMCLRSFLNIGSGRTWSHKNNFLDMLLKSHRKTDALS